MNLAGGSERKRYYTYEENVKKTNQENVAK
jgi:hypothetical protein